MNNDNGLVDEYEQLQKQKKEIKEDRLKKKIIELAKLKNTEILFGNNKKCYIKEDKKVVYPKDKETLANLLKKDKIYDIFSQINYSGLSSAIVRKDINVTKEVFEQIKIIKEFKVTLTDKEGL
ncbi:MAG: hypothetical protein KKE50_03095 [Nanoarchaeota archaeon]|nr:hypothetical protein [Nanoarchaeota archaeon]